MCIVIYIDREKKCPVFQKSNVSKLSHRGGLKTLFFGKNTLALEFYSNLTASDSKRLHPMKSSLMEYFTVKWKYRVMYSINKFFFYLGFDKYKGGLDSVHDLTGTESVYTSWRGIEIMFHVSTLLPHEEHDPQKVTRCFWYFKSY